MDGVSSLDVADPAVQAVASYALAERDRLKDVELQKKFQIAAQKFNNKAKEVSSKCMSTIIRQNLILYLMCCRG